MAFSPAPRFHVLVRTLAGMGALVLVVQCGGSPAPTSASATTAAAPPVTTAFVDATSMVDTSVAVARSPVTTSASTTMPPMSTDRAASTSTTVAVPVLDPNCPLTPHAAVVDRDRQRAWLCDSGVALPEFVVTTAVTLPDPGTFFVYAKDLHASSTLGGHYSTMTHFVAFARGERTGARVGFHTVPILASGEYAQPLDSVGTLERHGDTSGCIRVLPEQGAVVWDWLQVGDAVRVIT